jgi:DNA helicase-2/ATP-dependent DNA helicase PcrA
LYAERHHVREVAKKNVYTGKTYNSLENIAQFFADRGVQPPRPPQVPAPPPPVVPPRAAPVSKVQPPKGQKGLRMGSVIQHPKYGRGTVLRREGEGEDAKLTISFPGYGLKKLVEKYAGLKTEE